MIEVQQDQALFRVAAKGKIQAADFDRLSPLVVTAAREHGHIRLLFDFAEFGGWADTAAAAAHFRFVKDHHRTVERIAALGKKEWQRWVSSFAGVFFAPEIRFFEPSERSNAEAWLAQVESGAFLTHPGARGAVGAIMDEYARAAGEFCSVLETFSQEEFEAERETNDPDCLSAKTIAIHACRAARGYAAHLGRSLDPDYAPPEWPTMESLRQPADTRLLLAATLRHTETVATKLREIPDDAVSSIRFEAPWGSIYDPESLLEHAICHLLRHRRQLERWRL